MFNKKQKFVSAWSVTRNPNKFGEDVILSLGLYKKDKILDYIFREIASIRLDKDQARELCDMIMKQFDE